MPDLHPAWGNTGPDEPPWAKDRLIARLRDEGHTPISVSRAVCVVEQCDEGDSFPAGWSTNPLRITVHPDPDAGFGDEPTRLVIHGGRAGLMEVFTTVGDRTRRMVGVDAAAVAGIVDVSSLVTVEAILTAIMPALSGYYMVRTTERGFAGACVEHDAELERLGQVATDAVRTYQRALAGMPDLFRTWSVVD